MFCVILITNIGGIKMGKKIIIESDDNGVIKKVERNTYKRNKLINNRFIEWLIYMVGYAIVLITVSFFFKSFTINMNNYGLYALLASIIIYILNQTIKPVITWMTLPITILSWGLLYPITNVIILYLTSFILGSNNFHISNIFAAFFIAIFISLLNILMEGLVLKPITRNVR